VQHLAWEGKDKDYGYRCQDQAEIIGAAGYFGLSSRHGSTRMGRKRAKNQYSLSCFSLSSEPAGHPVLIFSFQQHWLAGFALSAVCRYT